MASHSYRSCPACANADARWGFAASGYPLVTCRGCGTLFVSPLPAEDAVRSTYLAPDYHEGAEASVQRMRAEAQSRAQVLADLGVGRVLEVGCGPGHFLDACADLGIEVEGIDPARTAEGPRSRGHVVHDVWLQQFEPASAYDAVAMWEVLEHLPEPSAALRRIRPWLVGPRVLALSTPSFSGIPARILGRRFPMITPPDHLALFTRDGLRILLHRHGFDPRYWTSFSGLDSAKLRRGFQRYLVGRSLLGAATSAVLGTMATVPSRVVDRLGLGISFEVFAIGSAGAPQSSESSGSSAT